MALCSKENLAMCHGARVAPCIVGFAMMLTVALPPLVFAENPVPQKREKIGEVLGKSVYRDQIQTGQDVDLAEELHHLFLAPVSDKYRREHKAEITPTVAEIDAATIWIDKHHQEERQHEDPKLREMLKTVRDNLAHLKLTESDRESLDDERLALETQLIGEEPKVRQELKSIKERLSRSKLTDAERQRLESQKFTIEMGLKPPGKDLAHFIVDNWKLERHLYDRFGGGRILWQQAGLEAFDATRNWLEAEERNGSFKITDPKFRKEFYRYWHRAHGSFMLHDKDSIREQFLEPEWARPKAK
jgi:hypothetical protein